MAQSVWKLLEMPSRLPITSIIAIEKAMMGPETYQGQGDVIQSIMELRGKRGSRTGSKGKPEPPEELELMISLKSVRPYFNVDGQT